LTPNPNPNQVTGEAQDDEAKPAPRPVAASLGGGDEEPKTFEEALYAGIGAVVAMFHRFDPNGTEEVDRADFRKTLGAVLPGNFGSDDFDDLFVRFEVDQRGKVNYEDFNRLVRKEYHASLKANRAAVKGPDEAEKKPPARPWRRAAETTTPTLPLPLPLPLSLPLHLPLPLPLTLTRRAAENFALSEESAPARRGRPQPLHNVRKREVIRRKLTPKPNLDPEPKPKPKPYPCPNQVIRLLRHFSQQHDDGICRVRSFKQL
jgi:hypothetical protein